MTKPVILFGKRAGKFLPAPNSFADEKGGNMVSQLSGVIQKEMDGYKKREQKARLEGKQEGKQEGILEERKAIILRMHKTE